MEKTEYVIKEFIEHCEKNNIVARTMEYEFMEVNPQNIVSIQGNFDYPDILEDEKSIKLIDSISKSGWINNYKNIVDFTLLMLPDGRLCCSGNGNHRAVVTKYLGLTKVRANVGKFVIID